MYQKAAAEFQQLLQECKRSCGDHIEMEVIQKF